MLLLSALSLLLGLLPAAPAAAPPHLVVLHGGITGLTGPAPGADDTGTARHVSTGTPYSAEAATLGAGVLGRITLHGEHVALEAGAREALATQDRRTVGAIFFGARFTPPPPVHLRLGFAHNHETPIDIVAASPAGAILGTAEGIRHRTGIEAGVGTTALLSAVKPLPPFLRERGGLAADLSVGWLPDHGGPHVYAYLDLTGSLGVGKPR